MLDLEQVARAIDDAVAPVTADEARARAGARTHFRRTAVLVSAGTIAIAGAAIFALLVALGLGRHSTDIVVSESPTTTTVGTPTSENQVPTVALGEPMGKIDIPAIDVHWVFVQGSRLVDEAKGPMHDPRSPVPGEPGNVMIAGHRTTHGAPFFHLGELHRDDVIQLTTLRGQFTYYVDREPFVLAPGGDPFFPDNIPESARCSPETRSLTLITDNPKYSAAQRLVVTARMGTEPVRSCAR